MASRSLFTRLARHIREFRWTFLGCLWLIAFTLGCLGWANYLSHQGRSATLMDEFYLTLQLIPMNSGGVPGPIPLALEIARLLIPVLAAATAIQALADIFQEQLQGLRLGWQRHQVIICGLSRKGYLLARRFLENQDVVVVIERDEENDYLAEVRRAGAIVLLGDATDTHLLERAGIQHARALIAVCDDSANAMIALQARRLAVARLHHSLTCVVHLADPRLCELLAIRELDATHRERFRLEYFNVYAQGARLLLLTHPAFTPVDLHQTCAPKILIVGVGQMGESLIVQLAQDWRSQRPAPDQKARLILLDREAEMIKDVLLVRYPSLAQTFELTALQLDVRSAEFQQANFLFDSQGGCDVQRVYVCLDDDSLGLQAGLALQVRMGESPAPVVVRVIEQTGLAALLTTPSHPKSAYSQLYAFSLLDRTCQPVEVLGGRVERLARAIHERYYRLQSAGKDPAQLIAPAVPWERLPEHFRESNRRQADHIGEKLTEINCWIVPFTDWERPLLELSPQEVDFLARQEHERWRKEKLHEGWSFAPPPKNESRKTNPDLVDWEDLPPLEIQKNRDFVNAWPALLAQIGCRIERRRSPAAGGS